MSHSPKVFFILMTALLSLLTVHVHAQADPDEILGKWTNEDQSRILEFVKTGNGYEAVIRKAPDKSLIGRTQLSGLRFSEGMYRGQLHLPKKGKMLPCTIKFLKENRILLSARSGFVSQSQTWNRVLR